MAGSLVIGGQLGNYLIEALIGRGGMSVVYRATHLRLNTPVAVKVLAEELSADDKFRERFLREAKMAAGIDHPNVVPIYDTGLFEDSLYIVMRYVPGGDLKGLLKASGPLSPEQTVAVLLPIARALDAAHTYGLVHRDVKPANILLQRGPDGTAEHVYLSDFGVTKHSSSVSGLTGTGALVGTIDYMSPEQIQGRDVSPQTDVYALACVFYQCVTGHSPFDRDSPAAVLWAHVREDLEPPSRLLPGLPTGIDAPILKAMAKEPGERFTTCEQFVQACAESLVEGKLAPADLESVASSTITVAPTGAPPLEGEDPGPEEPPIDGSTLAAQPAQPPPPPPSPPPPAPPAGAPELEPALAGATLASAPSPPSGPDRPGGSGARHWIAERWWLAAVIVLLVGGAIAGIVGLSGGGGDSSSSSSPSAASKPAPPATAPGFPGALKPVPTNHVTADGNAIVRLTGNVATVSLDTAGLLAGAPHALHIHAGAKGQCPTADAAKIHGGHRTIATHDGGAFYGPPVAALTTRGDTSPKSILAFARFTRGDANYVRRFTMPAQVAAYIRENNAVVVVHGIDYNSNGLYDGVLDRSDIDRKFPGEATAPALCGPLVGKAGQGGSADAGGTRTYMASLTRQTPAPVENPWLCHSPGARDGSPGSELRLAANPAQTAATITGT